MSKFDENNQLSSNTCCCLCNECMQSRKRCFRRIRYIVNSVLRKEGFHGRQSRDEALYSKRNKGSRGFKSFEEFYNEIKTRRVC